MADRIRVGNAEIVSLTDADGPLPFTLDQVIPNAPASEWEPYRQRYPRAFAVGDRWHTHFGCFLVRSGAARSW